MGKKIIRKSLNVDPSAELHHLVASGQEVLDLGEEGEISIPLIRQIQQSEAVARELNIYLRQYTKRRGVANQILRYLRYVASLGGAIGATSLSDYRNYIDKDYKGQPSGKAQLFNVSRNFVAHFMAAGHIPDEELPNRMNTTIARGTKPTFSEIAGSHKHRFKGELVGLIGQAEKHYGLSGEEALTYAYCKESMRVIHEFALGRIQEWEQDFDWVESVISGLTPERASSLSCIESFKETDFPGQRTLEFAFEILASKYSRVVPTSLSWPVGLGDFLKRRGWAPRRVCGAFFPTTVQVGDVLSAILSHEKLKPNVDSVAFGLYFDQIRPASERGLHLIYFNKNRGNSTQKTLYSNDPLVQSLIGLKTRLLRVLPDIPGGKDHLSQRDAPILIHITNAAGRQKNTFRTLDPSSTSNIVQRLIRLASEKYRILEPLVLGGASGENFRSTHVTVERLAGHSDGRIKLGLDHKSLATTARYADRVEVSSVIMGKYQAFQQFLVDEASKLPRTGSGYLCAASAESVCGDLNMCFDCEAKRIVLSSPEIAAEWIAWSTKISSNRSSLQMGNPERWSKYWAVKLAEYQSLIDQLDQRTFRHASKLAENLALPPLD